MTKLQDADPMPIGHAHLNTLMQDVPVDYLHFLWQNGLKSKTTAAANLYDEDRLAVANYIRKNLKALKLENKDLIWT